MFRTLARIMRSPVIGTLLVVLLMLSGLTTCLLSARWFFATREIQRLQARADSLTRTSNLMQQLAAESVEYGRRNPAINPLLEQLNLKASAARSATNTPGPMAPRP